MVINKGGNRKFILIGLNEVHTEFESNLLLLEWDENDPVKMAMVWKTLNDVKEKNYSFVPMGAKGEVVFINEAELRPVITNWYWCEY